MSYEQYWNDDPQLVSAYAKANELKYNRREFDLWKSGYYVLLATGCLWDKNTTYPEEPKFLIKDDRDIQLQEKYQMQDMRKYWEMWAAECNSTVQKSQ